MELELFNLSHFSDKTKCNTEQQTSSSDSTEIEKTFTKSNSTMNNNSLQTSIESNNNEIDFFSSTPQQLGEECNLNIKNPPETFPFTSTPIQISTPRIPTTTLDIITLKSKPIAVKRKKANYSNSATILIKLFGEIDFVKRYDFLRKQAKNSNTHFNIKNYKTHSKTVLQHLNNLQNKLINQIQDIERKTLFQNNECNICPDECSSKIEYTDTLKKLKYITKT